LRKYPPKTVQQIFNRFDPSLKIHSVQDFGGDGLYNQLFLVQTENGDQRYSSDKYVLRIAPPDDLPKLFYEEQMMHSEPVIHNLVLNQTEVPAPEIYYHDFRREIIDADYMIMKYLPGGSGRFSHTELGEFVRQLHEITGNYYGYPERDLPRKQSWREAFLDYVRRIFTDCLKAGAIDKSEFDWFLARYKQHREVLHQPEPVLLHLDLWSANILTRDGTITGILDFDRGMFGDPELEFAVLDTYGYSTEDFFRGYGRERPENERARIRQRLYYVYEIIKYAFIRLARGGMRGVARRFVEECKRTLKDV